MHGIKPRSTSMVLLTMALITGISCSRKAERARIPESLPSVPKIDLVLATINDRPLARLTLDEVTDVFGRPSATADPTKNIGPILAYADQGLIFRFRNRWDDPRQPLWSIVVYLTPEEDSESHVQCLAFRGTFVQGITSDWKATRVMQAFADFNPNDSYDPVMAERMRLSESAQKAVNAISGKGPIPTELTAKSSISDMAVITVKFPASLVDFHYDENTKFLRYIAVTPLKQK